MSDQRQIPTMSQHIFTQGLSVEAVSVYLLCCSLAHAGTPLSTRNLMHVWNSTEDALHASLNTLEARNIVSKILSDGQQNHVYRINDAPHWK
jgi:hypothetical protein